MGLGAGNGASRRSGPPLADSVRPTLIGISSQAGANHDFFTEPKT